MGRDTRPEYSRFVARKLDQEMLRVTRRGVVPLDQVAPEHLDEGVRTVEDKLRIAIETADLPPAVLQEMKAHGLMPKAPPLMKRPRSNGNIPPIYTLGIAPSARFSGENWFDAELIDFPGSKDVHFINPHVDEYQRGAPKTIEFVGDSKAASQFDYLQTVPYGFLLVSKRFVQTLEAIAPFQHELFPTVIYSRPSSRMSELFNKLFRSGGSRKGEIEKTAHAQISNRDLFTNDFVILKMRTELDCLDHERTMIFGKPFSQSEEEFLAEDDADHYAFREPRGGFPPVFCVPELLFYCYSEEAKQACERAGLKGLRFEPLP